MTAPLFGHPSWHHSPSPPITALKNPTWLTFCSNPPIASKFPMWAYITTSQSSKCTFCKWDLESLCHLLYNCPLSRAFWTDLEIFWTSISGEEIYPYKMSYLAWKQGHTPYLTVFFLLPKYTLGRVAEVLRFLQILLVLRIKLKLNTRQNSLLQRILCNVEFLKKKCTGFQVG